MCFAGAKGRIRKRSTTWDKKRMECIRSRKVIALHFIGFYFPVIIVIARGVPHEYGVPFHRGMAPLRPPPFWRPSCARIPGSTPPWPVAWAPWSPGHADHEPGLGRGVHAQRGLGGTFLGLPHPGFRRGPGRGRPAPAAVHEAESVPPKTILPPDLFKKYQGLDFWRDLSGTGAHMFCAKRQSSDAVFAATIADMKESV